MRTNSRCAWRNSPNPRACVSSAGARCKGSRRKGHRVVTARTNTGRIEADAFVVSLGSYSPLLLAPLGVHLPVYPLKGYSITLRLSGELQAKAPTVSLTDEAHKLVLSRFGDRLRCAGTAELTGYDISVNRTRCEAIVRRVRQLFPALSAAGEPEFWAGLRPATPNNVPVIGRTRLANLYVNTGHGTLGWTLAAGSGRAIADLVSGRPPEVDFGFFGRMKPSESLYVPVRGLRYHVRRWPGNAQRRMVLLHGWMDVSASFQFLVDALRADWEVLAPDWRGYGLTEWGRSDCYWFPDYLADLDALLDQVQPGAPVDLVGHSLGGNVACLYAGIRPARIRRLVNLEGFGMSVTQSAAGAGALRAMAGRAAQREGLPSLCELRCARRPAAEGQSAPHARARGVPRAPLGPRDA
jgi:hypothetical protein